MPEIPLDNRAQGFLIGLAVAFAIGFVSNQLLFAWNSILRFFSPTRPSLSPGPSPFASMTGCLTGLLTIALLAFAAVAVYWLVFK